jgi:Na+-driven multidrug efflux pump
MLMFGWFGLPALGLDGVAWATVVIQLIGVVYMGRVIIQKNIFCKGCGKWFKPRLKYFKEISSQGFPASLNMLTVAIGIFVITYFISPFGKGAVAAYGIATRIDQIALLPSIGLNIAALTLIGQNNGAGQFERCKEIYRTVMRYGLFVSLAGMLGVLLFARELMSLFAEDAEVVEVGAYYLRISILIYWAY